MKRATEAMMRTDRFWHCNAREKRVREEGKKETYRKRKEVDIKM